MFKQILRSLVTQNLIRSDVYKRQVFNVAGLAPDMFLIFSCKHYLSFFTYPSKLPEFLLSYPNKPGESKNACSCIAKQTMKLTVRFGYEN